MSKDLIIVMLVGAGALLIYAAVKGENPADVVRSALNNGSNDA